MTQEADQRVPTMIDVLSARARISLHLRPTPLYPYPSLSELVGAETWVKHENHQPIGAFKVRGGINLISQLSDGERARGVISASTGNHGQSVAYAARLFGVGAIVCVPEGANPVKVESMRALHAEIVHVGRDFDDAREHAEGLASQHGHRYIHSGNEPLLISGVATETLEILEEQPGLNAIIVPVGGGSGAAGACIVASACKPSLRVIGVQSEAAPAAYRSWKEGRLVEDRMQTFAEGLAHPDGVRAPPAYPPRASGPIRSGERRGHRLCPAADDREDAEHGRGRGGRTACRRHPAAGGAPGEAGGLDLHRGKRQHGSAEGAA